MPGQAASPHNYLAPLSQQQLRQQARQTITSAYAPLYQNLNQQQSQSRGLADRRAADDRYYQSWLDTQMQAIQAHADAANQNLQNMEHQLTDQQNQLYSQQAPNLINQANQRAGNVSNNQQSNTFGNELAQQQTGNQGLLNASEQGATLGMQAANSQLAGARANDSALIQVEHTKQMSDLQTALTKIASQRSLLQTKESGDIAKEIARLQGVEIQKAQSNRDFAATLQKLQIQQANVNSEISTRQQNANTNSARLKLDLTKAQQAQMNADRNFQLNSDKFGAQTARDLYERNHGLGPYRAGGGRGGRGGSGGGGRPLGQASQNTIINHVRSVAGEIDGLIGQGFTPNQAYQAVRNGGYSNRAGHWIRVFQERNTQYLNAGYNARQQGSGLTPGDVSFLHSQGVIIGNQLNLEPQPGSNIAGYPH